jgi:hypothetical protein
MSNLGATALTLVDWMKRKDPNGQTAKIIELLTQRNDVLSDVLWKEGNLPNGHQTTVRTGLPDVYYRLVNKGVAPSKSTTTQITEGTSILEARSEVDCKLAEMNGNIASFRLSEAKPFLEAMNQKTAYTMFYGNTLVNPEQFNGLSLRYASTSAGNGQNVLDGAGANSVNTSIWLVVWGEDTVCGIFPKGSDVGLKHEDLGIGDAFDSDYNRFRAYLDRYVWEAGISVRDWQFAVRIANIDVTKLVTESSAADLTELMLKAYARIPSFNVGTAAYYMNRTVFQMLAIQRRDAVTSGGGITYDNVDGKFIPKFMGIPVRVCDQLINTETHVA